MADKNELDRHSRLLRCLKKTAITKKQRSDSNITHLKDRTKGERLVQIIRQNWSNDQNRENVDLQRTMRFRRLHAVPTPAFSDYGLLRHHGNPKDPTRRLPIFLDLHHCRDCQSYLYSRRGLVTAKIQALPDSKELLGFLLDVLKFDLSEAHLELKDAQFVQRKPINNSRRRYQTCTSCAPMVGWNSVVQLRPHGPNKLPGHNLVRLICKQGPLCDLIMNFKHVGQGTDFFFSREKDAIEFSNLLPKFYTVKRGTIHKRNTMSSESCIPALICPICLLDLVYLPPQVSAAMGNLGPLVICTEAASKLTFMDPLNTRECTLSADEYWKAPFEPLMTSKDLIKFVVLDVEIVSRGIRNSLADVQVARVSDFGKNDKTFSVRSHLGHRLNHGHYAFGYDLCTANINMDVEKCKDLLPEFILVNNLFNPNVLFQRNSKNCKIAMKKRSPEYEGFLRDLENNPEAMFKLSLKSAEDEVQTSDMASIKQGENADFDVEDLLADLCLSNEVDEGGTGTSKK